MLGSGVGSGIGTCRRGLLAASFEPGLQQPNRITLKYERSQPPVRTFHADCLETPVARGKIASVPFPHSNSSTGPIKMRR